MQRHWNKTTVHKRVDVYYSVIHACAAVHEHFMCFKVLFLFVFRTIVRDGFFILKSRNRTGKNIGLMQLYRVDGFTKIII